MWSMVFWLVITVPPSCVKCVCMCVLAIFPREHMLFFFLSTQTSKHFTLNCSKIIERLWIFFCEMQCRFTYFKKMNFISLQNCFPPPPVAPFLVPQAYLNIVCALWRGVIKIWLMCPCFYTFPGWKKKMSFLLQWSISQEPNEPAYLL